MIVLSANGQCATREFSTFPHSDEATYPLRAAGRYPFGSAATLPNTETGPGSVAA